MIIIFEEFVDYYVYDKVIVAVAFEMNRRQRNNYQKRKTYFVDVRVRYYCNKRVKQRIHRRCVNTIVLLLTLLYWEDFIKTKNTSSLYCSFMCVCVCVCVCLLL